MFLNITTTKKIRYILQFIIGFTFGAYLLLLFFLNNSFTQQHLTQYIAETISHKIGTFVSIQEIQIGLFNRVILNDVIIKDKKGNYLLKAQRATAKIELRSLIKEQLSLRTISLLDSDIHIYKESKDGPTNLQFIIDAFSKPDKKEQSKLNLRINSLILRRINVSYDEYYRPQTPHRFNTGHIQLNQITTNISVKTITPDSLKLYIRALSFNESSGFQLKKAHFALTANRSGAVIRKLDVTLPNSHIRQEKLVASYDASRGWNQIFKTLRFKGKINNTHIASQDLKVFHPLLDKVDLNSDLSVNFIISPQQIQILQLSLSEKNKQIRIKGKANLDRKNGDFIGIKANLEKIHIQNKLLKQVAQHFKVQPKDLEIIQKLGDLDLNANCQYHIKSQEGKANLNLQTFIGKISVQSQLQDTRLSNKFNIIDLSLGQLLSKQDIPTNISMNGNVSISIPNKKISSLSGKAIIENLTWKGYDYRNIELAGDYKNQQVLVQLKSTDPNVHLNTRVGVSLHNGKVSTVKGEVEIAQIIPERLGIKTPYGSAEFQGKIKADLHNLSTRPTGSATLNDFCMRNSPRGDYNLDHLDINLQSHMEREQLQIRSDFLNAHLEGSRPLKYMLHDLDPLVRRSIPGLLPEKKHAQSPVHSVWNVQASIKRNSIFEKILCTPLNFNEDLNIRGTIDTGDGKSSLYIFTDGFNIGNQNFKETSLFLEGKDVKYHCLVKSKTYISNKIFQCIADLNTQDSCLLSKISWHANTEKSYDGQVRCTTRFQNKKQLDYNIRIHPSHFTLADTIWNIAPGEIESTNRTLAVKQFNITHADQSLDVHGSLSPYHNDSIMAKLNKIDIEYILGLVNFHAVDFGGKASGLVIFNNTAESPVVHAALNIPDFTFNHGNMGNTHLLGSWNKKDNRINLDAQMDLPKGNHAGTHVKGYVSLKEKGLDLHIHANRTNIAFLRRYMDGIFDNFDGEATGYVNLYGPFKQLDFKGDLTANAQARIISTGVNYQVQDGKVKLTPGVFAFNDFTIKDNFNGSGKANGYLKHNHLQDLTYKFDIIADHLLCYDMPQTDDLPFYSTATGSGKIQLEGFPGNFIANISLRPESPTKLVYVQGTPEALSAEDPMIRFHTAKDERPQISLPDSLLRRPLTMDNDVEKEEKEEESTTNIVLNFLIATNPSAELKIITDPRSGDAITAYGSGAIRARFYNKGNFEMYGTYYLDRGTYKLSLQDVIRKDLKLRNDSKIIFSGNPTMAELGLNAVYTINGVSLKDLNYSAGFSDKSVNVDCILNIRGNASAPKVNFDLDLHNISDDEKQMVRQLIATDEDMNRQVIYLLGIGRFYATNPQISSGENGTQDASSAAMKSFLSTTITSQINSAISSAMGNESHWSFGTNIAPGVLGWEDVEVDGLLQGRLFNDRLLINGNFGYRDRPTYTSNFIGDFDIKYLLTPKGTISLKAYSETTDRYFTKSSLTTQGVGISLQRDFNRFKDLFQPKKRKKKITKTK